MSDELRRYYEERRAAQQSEPRHMRHQPPYEAVSLYKPRHRA